MALYPKAVLRLIKPDATDPLIDPDLAVLHVDAGNASSLYDWWVKNGTLECHFFVKKSGVVEQYVDTKWQADAQVGGAAKAISIETQGYGDGEWTPEQLAAIKELLAWLHEVEGIPLKVPANPYDSGVGYHSMFASSVPGTWARDGRTCPGADRIKQYRSVLVPWMSAPTKEDDMSAEDVKQVNDYTRDLLLDGYTVNGERKPSLLAVLVETQRRVTRTEAALGALAKGLGPQVEEAVRQALSTDYDAKVELTPKASGGTA